MLLLYFIVLFILFYFMSDLWGYMFVQPVCKSQDKILILLDYAIMILQNHGTFCSIQADVNLALLIALKRRDDLSHPVHHHQEEELKASTFLMLTQSSMKVS